jgi:hypothetical protein
MLTFEAPFYQIGDVIVFRDHAVKTQFYYLAGLPKLSLDSKRKPQFSMLKYRNALDAGGPEIKNRDALGGAFLMLGVDCAVDVDTVKGELGAQADVSGDINLSPVLYTSGTAQIVVLDYQPPPPAPTGPVPIGVAAPPPPVNHFVKSVVGSTTPSLLGDQRAIFSVSLDTDAATLIEAAYENDMSPIGVIYKLEFAGLRPALSVSAVVDYKRVYDQLKIDFQLGVHTDDSSTKVTQPTQPPAPDTPPGQTPPAGQPVVPPLAQAIQLKIDKPGALGAAAFRFLPGATPIANGGGTSVTTTAPVAPLTTFTWIVPGQTGTPGKLNFGAGPYVAGDQFVLNTDWSVGKVGNPTSPMPVAVKPPAVAPQQTPPARTTPPPAGAGTTSLTTPTQTDTTSSNSQVGLDVNIDYTMQKLEQTGAIKITIVREQEGASIDQMQKEAMDIITNDILKVFFTPQMTTMPQTPAGPTAPTVPAMPATSPTASTVMQNATQKNINPGTTTGSGTKVQIGFQLRDVHEETLETVTFDYSVQAPVTQTHAPNGFFSALIGRTNKADLIKEVSLDDAFFKTLQVTASSIADFTTFDLKSAVLDLAYGGTEDQPGTVLSPTFTAADNNPKTFQAFIENGEMTYRYRMAYYFGQNALVGAQTTEYHTGWRSTLSRALVVNPPVDVAMLHVYVAPGLIDWDLIAQIETTLSYDDPANNFHAERSFVIGPTFQKDDWVVRLTNPALTTYNVQHTWILKDNDRRIKGPVQPMSAAQLFVFDPFVDRLPIILQPEVDPANVARITVAFHYQDSANQLDVRKLVELAPPYKTTTVSIPVMDLKKRKYSYQTTIFKVSGGAENRPEVTTDQISIPIADGSMPLDVTVSIIGDLAQAGLSALQVDLRAEPLDGQAPAVQSHLFQGADNKWVQRLLLRTDRPTQKYQVQTTAFSATKDPVQSDWNDHDTAILAIQPNRLQP